MSNFNKDTVPSDGDVTLVALSIIKEHLHGMPVIQALRVLTQTELLLRTATMVTFKEVGSFLAENLGTRPHTKQAECEDYFKTWSPPGGWAVRTASYA